MNLLFCFLLLGVSIQAQDPAESGKELRPRYYEGTLFGKVNALSFFDPLTPTFQPSLEYRFSERMSAELTLGIPAKLWAGTFNTDTTYHRYFKIKGELRFFPGGRFFYLAPGLFITKRKYSKYGGGFIDKGDDYAYDYGELQKTVIGFVFKTGRVIPLSEFWNLEPFLGFGPRFVKFQAETQGLVKGPQQGIMFRVPDRLGWSTRIHFEVGFKVSRTIY